MLINATVAYVAAVFVVIFLHELAHAFTGMVLGSSAIQVPFGVEHDPMLTGTAAATASLAGPIFSLVTGLLAMTIRPFGDRGFWAIAWAWFAFASAMEGFGYFTIAGIIHAGDTASALAVVNAPGWTYWACFVFGIGGQFFLAWRFAPVGARLTIDPDHLRALAVWPWLIGTGITTALMGLFVVLSPDTSAEVVVAVLFGTIALGVWAPMSMMFLKGHTFAERQPTLPDVPWAGVALVGILIVINLLLTRAPHWG